MKILTPLLIIILFGSRVYSQTKFFISPTVNQKIYISSASHFDNNGIFYNPVLLSENPYFDLRIRKFSTRKDIPIGINVGVSFMNNKHILNLGYSQDGVGTSMEYSSISKGPLYPNDPDNPVFLSFVSSMNSIHYINRVSIMYSFCLNFQSFHKNKVYLTSDFSLLYGKSRTGVDTYDYVPPVELLYNNAQILKFQSSTAYKGGISYMLSCGLLFDYGIRVKDDWRYIFSIGINYRHGLKTIQGDVADFLINDNGNLFHLHYEAQSKGSGIYFELSRRFQLYSWKKKNKT